MTNAARPYDVQAPIFWNNPSCEGLSRVSRDSRGRTDRWSPLMIMGGAMWIDEPWPVIHETLAGSISNWQDCPEKGRVLVRIQPTINL